MQILRMLLLICAFLMHHSCFAIETIMSSIPKKIWQTYKTKELPPSARRAQETWFKNDGYSYFLWDDSDIENYILQRWDRDTYLFFKEFRLGVMKADLWRYLILATEGGIYSDIDSICCQPISNWPCEKRFSCRSCKNEKTVNPHVLIVGLENDYHFCQWTIAATPNHPAMLHICRFIVEKWKMEGINYKNPHFVHATTGPAVWTEGLLDYLGEPRQRPIEMFDRYTRDKIYKKKLNELGVYLVPQSFFAGIASKNLYPRNFKNRQN